MGNRSYLLIAALAVTTTSATAQTSNDALADSLHALVRRASPDLAARRAAVIAAERRAGAAGRPLPMSLMAEAEGVPSVADVTRAQSVRVQAERELVPSAVRSAQRAVAAADVDIARAQLRLGEQRVVALADRALLAAAGWTSVARRLANEDSQLVSAEASLRTRFAVGDARYVDVLRMRTERLHVESDRARALASAQAGGRALEALVGDTPDDVATVRRLANETAAIEVSARMLATLAPAPDVDSLLAASGQVALADAALAGVVAAQQRALADQRPRLAGFLGVQRFAGEGGFPIGPVAGATISLPFTARSANAARASAAAGDVLAATSRRRATVASLRATLLAARDRYESARTRVASFDAALLRGANDERESALAAYRSGSLSLLELLDFERALARAEVERLRNRIEAADALAALFGADDGAALDLSFINRDVSDDR